MQRACFAVCRGLGRMLRAGRYSTVHIVWDDAQLHVRKYRRWYAPLLVSLGGVLVRLLDTGVRVLPQHQWEERECLLYRELYGKWVGLAGDGVLVLPCLPGATLAALLDDPQLQAAQRVHAIELAVAALVALHRSGFTHGDAMAENVMVDAEADVACWFDFETVHHPERTLEWRRADDLRALLATCLLRTEPDAFAATADLILDRYGDDAVAALLPAAFSAACRRALVLHLGQAALSFEQYRRIEALLTNRRGA